MRKMISMLSLLGRYVPYWLTVVFVGFGLISCGGGGGGDGGGGSAGQGVAECFPFVSGYTWGSVRSANIQLGGETASNAMIQVIADPAVPAAPRTCSSSGPAWNSVQSLGANGLIGISNFAQDCGQGCSVQAANGYYYSCSGSRCSPLAVSIANQLRNPVALFSGDNNGTIMSISGLSSTSTTPVNGTLTFGIGTQTNNGVGSATVLTVDSIYGEFSSSVNGVAYPGLHGDPGSFIDSGSNGLFYGTSVLLVCGYWYCPPAPTGQSGLLQGQNGANVSVNFTVSSPPSSPSVVADTELAGTQIGGGVDWGLPLFFGRTIYTAIEGMGTTADGFWVGIGSGSPTAGTNQIPVMVDAGPAGVPAGSVINAPYVSVTLCVPGTTNCQTIDHVLVDTGSSGVRILSSVLQPALLAALPQSTP